MSKFKNLRRHFATDKEAEQNGKWFTHPESGIKVKLGRSTSDKYLSAIRRHSKPYQGVRITLKVQNEIKMKAMAEELIFDWDLGDGTPFDAAGALEAFREMPDFWAWCDDRAESFESFRVEQVEEDAGPLSDTSAGSANGEPLSASPSSNAGPDAASL